MVQKETKTDNQSGVDKGLIKFFLKMNPEERLRANDNAIRALSELRHAFKKQENPESGSKRSTERT